MVIFLYNLYIFRIHHKTVLYPKSCYNEQFYKEVYVYLFSASTAQSEDQNLINMWTESQL